MALNRTRVTCHVSPAIDIGISHLLPGPQFVHIGHRLGMWRNGVGHTNPDCGREHLLPSALQELWDLSFCVYCRVEPWEPRNGLRVTVASLGITIFPSLGLAQWLSLNSWLSFRPESLALPLPPLATLGISQEVCTMNLLLIEEDKNSLGLQTGRGWGGQSLSQFWGPYFS